MPTPIHAEHYAKIVADGAFMRRLISAGGKIAAIGFQNQFDPETALEKSEQILFDIANRRANGDFESLSDVLREYLDQLACCARARASATGSRADSRTWTRSRPAASSART